ncbi:hypothetical protein Lal_00024031 [Lupinus albus]|nr:hypothetical protein Lal_00024031 [Lupinus albus]
MEARKEKNSPWLSVPQFGDWDQKGEVPDYSMDFSKIRETRKQNKTNISRASLGNEEEFINSTATSVNTAHTTQHHHPHHYDQTHSPTLIFFNLIRGRGGKVNRTRGYPPEPNPNLTGKTRYNWVRVRVFPDIKFRVRVWYSLYPTLNPPRVKDN